MAQDYIHYGNKGSKKNKSKSKRVWFALTALIILIILMAAGLYVLVLLHHKKMTGALNQQGALEMQSGATVRKAVPVYEAKTSNTDDVNADASTKSSKKEPAKQIIKNSAAQKPVKFDFYTMLPKSSVETLDPQAVTANPQVGSTSYFLQLGTFSTKVQALAFKQSLAQKGFNDVKLVPTYQSGQLHYRVQIGPYKQLEDMKKIQAKLQENAIDAILIVSNRKDRA